MHRLDNKRSKHQPTDGVLLNPSICIQSQALKARFSTQGDCRLLRNNLRGSQGNAINALSASAGFNFRQLLGLLQAAFSRRF